MFEMPFWIAGRKRGRHQAPIESGESTPAISIGQSVPLTTVRMSTSGPVEPRSFGRRDADFSFDRVFIPSLIIDHTELVLRQAGACGEEGFVLWAGTLAGGSAHVSSMDAASPALHPQGVEL